MGGKSCSLPQDVQTSSRVQIMFEIYALIIFLLACYGGAVGICFSRLLLPFRLWLTYKAYHLDEEGKLTSGVLRTNHVFTFLSKLVHCPLCVGFWLGIIFSVFIYSHCYHLASFSPAWSWEGAANPFIYIFDGFLGSAGAWILHLLLRNRMEGA